MLRFGRIAVMLVALVFLGTSVASLGTLYLVVEDKFGSRAWTVPDQDTQDAIGKIIDGVDGQEINNTLTHLVNYKTRYYKTANNTKASIWLHDYLNNKGRLTAEYDNSTHNT